MSLKCPYCSHENPDGSAFCQSCNRMLQQATGSQTATQQPHSGGYQQQPPQQPQPGWVPPQQGNIHPGTAGMYPPPSPSPIGTPGVYPPPSPPPISMPVQMGTSAGGGKQLFARRAFAGRGTSIEHNSWLLKGQQEKAQAVFAATRDLLLARQQEVLELKVESKPLKGPGVRAEQDEERLYIVMKRGITTIFLYIAPIGSNLYISRTTSVLPLISLMRAGLLVLGAIATVVFYSSLAQRSYPSGLFLILLSAIIAFIFFWLPVLVLLIPSIFHAIIEGDFWVYLRERTLTSFQVDDVMVLERLTDYILGVAVEQVGLNRDLIELPKDGYKPRQVVRGF